MAPCTQPYTVCCKVEAGTLPVQTRPQQIANCGQLLWHASALMLNGGSADLATARHLLYAPAIVRSIRLGLQRLHSI